MSCAKSCPPIGAASKRQRSSREGEGSPRTIVSLEMAPAFVLDALTPQFHYVRPLNRGRKPCSDALRSDFGPIYTLPNSLKCVTPASSIQVSYDPGSSILSAYGHRLARYHRTSETIRGDYTHHDAFHSLK